MYREISNFFFPALQVTSIVLVPEKSKRLLTISISYIIREIDVIDSLEFYTNSDYDTDLYTFEDIEYVDENLLSFCQSKKPDMIGERLILSEDTGYWTWGKYQFINFKVTDTNFAVILQICNTD